MNIFNQVVLFTFIHQITMTINFSSRTTSMDIQRNLEANVEKRTKETYGPPMGKRLLIFMDDMNMPKVPLNQFVFILLLPYCFLTLC